MSDDYMAKVERDWRNADYRDSIIEECARVVEQYYPSIDKRTSIAAAIRALKDKS